MTVEACAKVLHISRASAYEAVRTGAIPHIVVGRRLLVKTAMLRQMLGIDPTPSVNSSKELKP